MEHKKREDTGLLKCLNTEHLLDIIFKYRVSLNVEPASTKCHRSSEKWVSHKVEQQPNASKWFWVSIHGTRCIKLGGFNVLAGWVQTEFRKHSWINTVWTTIEKTLERLFPEWPGCLDVRWWLDWRCKIFFLFKFGHNSETLICTEIA